MSKRRIGARDIVVDVRSGLSKDELMNKYQLSSKQLDHVLKKTFKASRDLAKIVAEDIRQGIADSRLMEKYRLSRDGLQHAFDKLLEAGFIDQSTYDSHLSNGKPEPYLDEKRQGHRRVPRFPVTVVDRADPRNMGRVKDISGRGLAVIGVKAHIGEDKSIAILGDDLGVVSPFEVRAECRWVSTGSGYSEPMAGFQIRAISERDLAWLKEFIEIIDLGTLEFMEENSN